GAPGLWGRPPFAPAVTVIVARQTMEIGAVLGVAAFELRSRDATAIIVAAVAVAAAVSVAWMRIGRTAPSAIVSTVTTAFATVFVCELTLYAVHEWAEAHVLPWSDAVHAATEAYGPDGIYGVHFSDLLVVAPVIAIGSNWMRARVAARRHSSAAFRRRFTAAGLIGLCCVFMGLQQPDAPPPRPAAVASPAAIATVVARPHLLFRETTPGPNFGHLAVAALDDLSARFVTATGCQRVSFAGGRGLCLHVDRGVFNTYSALLLNEQLEPGAAIKLAGLPSRTRAAADGRVGAITVFVLGDGYAAEFSTRTTIVDLATGDEIGELEQFTTWRNGERFRAVDFNFWGVTFARDGNTFYASLRTAGVTYLVRGGLALRKLTVLRENVECPSLLAASRLRAYWKRGGPRPH